MKLPKISPSRLWRPALMLLVVAALSYVLFFHNLNGLLPGFSAREVATSHASSSLRLIADSPLNAPYKVVVYIFQQIGYDKLLATRYAAATFATIATFLFFAISKHWFGYRLALVATALFATSSGLLHIGRLGSALVLQMAALLLLACTIWWKTYRTGAQIVGFASIAVFASLWYIPGAIWFELLALWLARNFILQAWRQSNTLTKVLAITFFVALVSPLLRGFVLQPASLLTFLGLPTHFASLSQTAQNFLDAILLIGIHSNGQAELWLAHAPLLNVTELALLVLGIYFFARKVPASRRVFMFGALGLSIVLIGLSGHGSETNLSASDFVGGPSSIGLLVPVLYLFVAGGVYEIVHQWLRVFPRNPIARFGGVALVGCLILFSVTYHVRAYFVAWPHSTATQNTFAIPE